MRNLLVTHDFPPLGGGIARWMAEFARRAILPVSTGEAADADDSSFRGGVDRLGVPVSRLKTVFGQWRWRRRVETLLRRHRSRFVWAGELRPAGPVALEAASTLDLPVGMMIHGGDLLQLEARYRRNPRRRRRARRLLSRPALLIANSHWTASLARDVAGRFDVPLGDRLRVVPLGSDPARFHPDRRSADTPVKLGLPEGRRWLLTVARLVPHKGIDRGIEVLGRLRHLYPELGYLVVGRGPDRERLGRLAHQTGVADRVHFAERVDDATLPEIHAMAEVYLGLSREEGLDVEGFGISLVDASASGVPVVAGRSGGTADAVDHEVTGVLVSPDDLDASTAAVDRLLADTERCQTLGRAGRKWVETSRNWDRVTNDLVSLSRSIGLRR